jgi:hypothetical protein
VAVRFSVACESGGLLRQNIIPVSGRPPTRKLGIEGIGVTVVVTYWMDVVVVTVAVVVVVRWLDIPTRYPAPAPASIATTSIEATIPFLMASYFVVWLDIRLLSRTASTTVPIAVGGIGDWGALKTRIVASLFVLTLLGLSLSLPAFSAASSPAVILNSAKYGTLGYYNGVTVNVTSNIPFTSDLWVFAVWTISGGETFAVTTGGLTLAPGASGIAFAPLLNPLTSGSYLVFVFAVTTSGPVSIVATISLNVC